MDLTPVVERLDRAVLLLEHIAAATANPAATAAPGAQIEEGLWNAEQVAAYLKCSESKVYKAAEALRQLRPDLVVTLCEPLVKRASSSCTSAPISWALQA